MQGAFFPLRAESRITEDDCKSIDDSDYIIIEHPLKDDERIPVFPTFESDKELLIFKRTKLVHCDVYAICPVLVLYVAGYMTRGNLPNVLTFGPWFTAVMVLGAITFFIYFLIFSTMVVRQIFRGNAQSVYFLLSKRILNTRLKHYFDESLPILVSMTTGLLLYARKDAGRCPTSDIWKSQMCNHVADCQSVPQDQVIVCLISPIVFQLLMKGVRFRTIILSWAIATFFVVITIVDEQAWADIWDIYYTLFVLFVLIESERLMRLSFLQNKVVLCHEANRNELVATARLHARAMRKAKYELRIVAGPSEKDKHEIEVERARLRSLIGNVAHDLKTPLQSISACLYNYLSVCMLLSVYLSVCLSVYLLLRLSACLCVCPYFNSSICLYVCPPTYSLAGLLLSLCLIVCLHVRLLAYLSVACIPRYLSTGPPNSLSTHITTYHH